MAAEPRRWHSRGGAQRDCGGSLAVGSGGSFAAAAWRRRGGSGSGSAVAALSAMAAAAWPRQLGGGAAAAAACLRRSARLRWQLSGGAVAAAAWRRQWQSGGGAQRDGGGSCTIFTLNMTKNSQRICPRWLGSGWLYSGCWLGMSGWLGRHGMARSDWHCLENLQNCTDWLPCIVRSCGVCPMR